MFGGSRLLGLLLICTRICCGQIVFQEFESPSFHYFALALSYTGLLWGLCLLSLLFCLIFYL